MTARLTAAFYFVAFWGIFLFFYAGSYNYGADVRYSLVSYAPLALLAGLGAERLVDWLRVRTGDRAALVAAVGVIAGTALTYAPHTRSVGEEAWAARADVSFAKRVAVTLPKDASILTQDPNMFHLWGINAAQMSFGKEQGFLARSSRRHGQHVYVHWGFWCNVVDPTQTSLCQEALADKKTELVEEYVERDYRYAFYRITELSSAGFQFQPQPAPPAP